MNNQVISEKWNLIKQDWKKILKGFIISLIGATAAYLSQVAGLIDYSNYGQYGPFVALGVGIICSNIANALNKFIGSTNYNN